MNIITDIFHNVIFYWKIVYQNKKTIKTQTKQQIEKNNTSVTPILTRQILAREQNMVMRSQKSTRDLHEKLRQYHRDFGCNCQKQSVIQNFIKVLWNSLGGTVQVRFCQSIVEQSRSVFVKSTV